jgi:hypothetical protein
MRWRSRVNIKGIVVVGTYTNRHQETVQFFRDVLQLTPEHDDPGFTNFRLPDTGKIEVLGPAHEHGHGDHTGHERFTTAPVPGFLVDDIVAARDELVAAGVELLGPLLGDPEVNAWQHFRAPDGNVYSLTFGKYDR